MKTRSIFARLFKLAPGVNARSAKRAGLQPMQLAAPSRYGQPERGWRKIQSVARHREIERRRRRNAA